MPLLNDDAVAFALETLRGWSGDAGRIARSVHVSAERAEELKVEIMGVADSVDHHPVVEHHGDALTFILWTHTAGGVTEKDLDLAGRIDAVIDRDANVAAQP